MNAAGLKRVSDWYIEADLGDHILICSEADPSAAWIEIDLRTNHASGEWEVDAFKAGTEDEEPVEGLTKKDIQRILDKSGLADDLEVFVDFIERESSMDSVQYERDIRPLIY